MTHKFAFMLRFDVPMFVYAHSSALYLMSRGVIST